MNFIFHLPSYLFRQGATSAFILVALLFGLFACGDQSRTENKIAQDSSSTPASTPDIESSLRFNNVTLDQADKQGQPVWKVRAKQAIYSQDKKVAHLQSPVGKLFQDGKAVYQITATQGEIQQDGKQLFLKGKIVATDPQNGVVLRGNELEWRPQEDLLIVRNQLTGTHRQVQVVAQEARVHSRASRMELLGGVVANATDTQTQMRTEHLIWQIREQKLIGDRPVEIDQFKGKAITNRATGNQAEFNLKTKIAILKQNAQLALVDPPLQVNSNNLNWNLNTEIVTADQPVRIVHRQQQMTVTANRGRMDLQKKIVYLTGNVYGTGQRGQSIKASQLNWYLPSQELEAEGDVVYHQVQPPVNLTGKKAFGKLQDQTIAVSGGGVITKITP